MLPLEAPGTHVLPQAHALACCRLCSSSQALLNESTSAKRTTQRIFQEVRALEADLLRTLSEQTSAEKSSIKTAADIRSLRAAAESEEMLIAEVQNELARLAVDALNTQGHNDRLKQALQLLDTELKEKVRSWCGVLDSCETFSECWCTCHSMCWPLV